MYKISRKEKIKDVGNRIKGWEKLGITPKPLRLKKPKPKRS